MDLTVPMMPSVTTKYSFTAKNYTCEYTYIIATTKLMAFYSKALKTTDENFKILNVSPELLLLGYLAGKNLRENCAWSTHKKKFKENQNQINQSISKSFTLSLGTHKLLENGRKSNQFGFVLVLCFWSIG